MEAPVKYCQAIKKLLRAPTFFTERPLIPFLLSFAGGIIVSDLTSYPWTVPASLALFPLSGLLLAFRFNKYSAAFLFLHLCLFLTGMLCMAPYTTTGPGKNSFSPGPRGEKTVYRGFIDDSPQISPDRIEYSLSGVCPLDKDGAKSVPGRVLLSAPGPDVFRYGDYIQFRARLAPPRNFNNPGGFDYRKYLYRKEILHRATIYERPDLILIRRGQGNLLKTGIESYRARLREFITRHTGSPEREIILSMTIGDQKAIPNDLQERFNQTGTSHILAISGFNIGMIAFFAVLFFRSALKIFPRLLLVWNATKVSYALALIPILLYAGVAGMGISVIRATLMVVVLMTAILIRRPKDLLNALALAAIIILGLSPPSLFDPSFQLSFAAIAAILYIPPKLQSLFPGKEEGDAFLRSLTRKWGRNFYLFLLVSISATLGTLPIIAYHFHRLSTVVLPANIAVIPFLGILTTPLCLLMIITYPISETLCLLLVQGAVYLIQISVFFVNFFSSLRGSSFLVPPPGWMEILVYYLVLCLLTLYLASLIDKRNEKSPIHEATFPPAARTPLLVFIPVLAGIVLYGYLSVVPSKYLKLTFIDVGQGSCTLLQIPEGKTLLIDGGGFEGSTFDVGRYVVAPFLLRKKIRKLDVVVLTHPHPDHLNGLVYILRNFPIGEVWSNGESAPYESYRSFKKIMEEKRIAHRVLYQGQPDRRINELNITILNPPSHPPDKPELSDDYKQTNDHSLVLHLRYGSTRILLPGDIAKDAEESLAALPDDLRSDIILAPHHGGRTSSTDALLEKVKPAVAVVSCGFENRYKDPHPDVIKRYEKTGTQIFRTDRDGAVLLQTDGSHVFDGKGKRLLP